MRFTIPWGITRKKILWEPPNFSLWEIPCFFIPKTLWEIPTFFLPTPLWEIPKKIWKKIFSSGYMDNCSPKNGGAPWGEGAWGDTYPPPMGYMGGAIAYQDYLFGCLFGYYLFSVLLISFFLAVSDAMLLFLRNLAFQVAYSLVETACVRGVVKF